MRSIVAYYTARRSEISNVQAFDEFGVVGLMGNHFRIEI